MSESGKLSQGKYVLLLAMVSCFLWGSATPSIKIGYQWFSIDSGDPWSIILFAGIRFFLVHLALGHKTRQAQLDYLMKIAAINPEPVVIAGDFNAFDGAEEIEKLIRKLDLYDPNREGLPTYPSGNPKLRLDFVLCSKTIRSLKFSVPRVEFSDHLPIVFDFEY